MKRAFTAILLALILVFAHNTSYSGTAQDDGVIRIETDLVLINATVTDSKGHYIPNLKLQDFLLEEEGTRREITHFAAEDAPFAAVILLDASGSMKTKLGRARVAAAQFAEHL